MKVTDTKSFIEKASQIHNNYYDYSKVNYINSKTKVIIICPIHGEFEQTPENHLRGHGCNKCVLDKISLKNTQNNTLSFDEFVERANKIHINKYTYIKQSYKNTREYIDIICPNHGLFKQRANSHLQGHGCPICNQSKGELEILKYLQNKGFQFEQQFKINCPQEIRSSGNIYVDFKLNYNNTQFIIEYNGKQHYDYIPYFHHGGEIDLIKQQNRDNYLKKYCELHNITLLEISYLDDITKKLEDFFKISVQE